MCANKEDEDDLVSLCRHYQGLTCRERRRKLRQIRKRVADRDAYLIIRAVILKPHLLL